MKFRASKEPFWDLKISKYVEYLTCVSSKYFTSSVLPSLTNTAVRTLRALLADVIPWINKASFMLYIICIQERSVANAALLLATPIDSTHCRLYIGVFCSCAQPSTIPR
jgi:hypothetical protein